MIKNLLVLYLFFILANIIESKEKEYVYEKLKYSLETFDIFPFTGNRNSQFELDMSVGFLWVTRERLRKNPNITVLQTSDKIMIENYMYNPEILVGKISICEKLITNFPFYYIKDFKMKKYDSFPLGLNIKHENMSIIHQLYNLGYINKLGFIIIYIYVPETNIVPTIYFGDFPKSELGNKKNKKIFNIQKTNYDTWGLNLDEIIIENKTYKINSYSYFQSNNFFILIPDDFFTMLRESSHFSYLFNKTCIYDVYNIHSVHGDIFYERFLCPNDKIKDLSDNIKITFVIDNHLFAFNKNDFIRQINETHSQILLQHSTIYNEWVFGISFLKKYFGYFDYKDKTITFYSEKPIKSTSDISIDNMGYFEILCALIIILCSISSITLFYMKYSLKKLKNQY